MKARVLVVIAVLGLMSLLDSLAKQKKISWRHINSSMNLISPTCTSLHTLNGKTLRQRP